MTDRPAATAGSALETPQGRRLGLTLFVAVALTAIGQRVFLIASTDFPFNDGGLFYAFIKATAATFPALPDTVGFNGLTIPFAYPPLAFWLAAGLDRMGMDPLASLRVLPILMNTAYVLLFALVLRRSGRPLFFVGLALFFACAMIRTFEWLIMGGGLSRGLGSVFLMMTLVAIRAPEGERRALPVGSLVAAGAAVAGAILSHLEWGLDAAACVILSRAVGSVGIRDFVRSILVPGITALLLISPWIFYILSVHGSAPFLAAGGSGAWDGRNLLSQFQILLGRSLDNPLVPLGGLLLLWQRKFFWPGFMLICMIVTPRHGETPTTLAAAVFAAEGALALFVWLRQRLTSARLAAVTAALVVAVLALFPVSAAYLGRGKRLHPLTVEVRQAMAWVSRTHPGASFAILNSYTWWYDSSAEWFPVLAQARSVNTVQGREWLPDRVYSDYYAKDVALKQSRSCGEILRHLKAYERPQFVWVEVRKDCFTSPDFRPVYRNAQVTIFEVPPVTAAHRS